MGAGVQQREVMQGGVHPGAQGGRVQEAQDVLAFGATAAGGTARNVSSTTSTDGMAPACRTGRIGPPPTLPRSATDR